MPHVLLMRVCMAAKSAAVGGQDPGGRCVTAAVTYLTAAAVKTDAAEHFSASVLQCFSAYRSVLTDITVVVLPAVYTCCTASVLAVGPCTNTGYTITCGQKMQHMVAGRSVCARVSPVHTAAGV